MRSNRNRYEAHSRNLDAVSRPRTGSRTVGLVEPPLFHGRQCRVVLEDSRHITKVRLARSNAEQTAKIHRIQEEPSLGTATPAVARWMLEMKGGNAAGS